MFFIKREKTSLYLFSSVIKKGDVMDRHAHMIPKSNSESQFSMVIYLQALGNSMIMILLF